MPKEKEIPPSMERNAFLSMDNNRKIETSGESLHSAETKKELGTNSQLKSKSEATKSMVSVIAGGFAGILAKTAVAPMERLKIMFQVTNEKFSLRRFPSIIAHICHTEGFLALWKGHLAAILRVFPYSGIQFGTFDAMKRWVASSSSGSSTSPSDPHLSVSMTMFCGGTAAGVSSITTYPLDLTRARLAIIPKGVDSKPFRLFRYIKKWHAEGGIFELYKGLTPTLLGVIPYGAIAFTVHEAGKKFVVKVTGQEPLTWHKLVCGALAGLAAQSVTYPFEVVRRRMQTAGVLGDRRDIKSMYAVVSPAAPSSSSSVTASMASESSLLHCRQKLNMITVLRGIIREQGVRGLFKGLSLNYIKGPIAISISFVSYDFFKTLFFHPD